MYDLSFSLILAVLKRHYRLGAAVFAIALTLSLAFALRYSTYRAIATVEIEASEIPASVTTPAGMASAEMMEALADLRISRLQQKVTSTASLVEIITKFNLYPNVRAEKPIALVADTMRKKIKLQLVSTLLANPAAAQKISAGQLSAIAFTIGFDYTDPLLSQQVTNELVSRFLDEDLKQRRQQAEETTAFLDEQTKQLENAMEEQEKKIATYKLESGDTRPEALAFNQQAAAQVSMNLQNVESQIAATNGTIGALRAQLAALDPYARAFADGAILASPALQLKALQTQYATLSAQYGPEHPDVLKTARQIQALKGKARPQAADKGELDSLIADLETKLAAAQGTLGEENPDVASMKRRLESLRTARAGAQEDDGAIPKDADNPAYLSVVSQLRAAQGQKNGLEAQRTALLEQQEKYQKALLGNPVAEQNLAALTRDYDNAQMRYREIKAKKMAADMSEKLERERKGQRMNVINPPELPLTTSPPRLLLAVAGLFVSLLAACGAIMLVQLTSQTLCGGPHMAAVVGVTPLACVPYLRTPAERLRLQRNKRYAIGAGAFAVLLLAAILSLSTTPFGTVATALTGWMGRIAG